MAEKVLIDPDELLANIRRAGTQQEIEIAVAELVEKAKEFQDEAQLSSAHRGDVRLVFNSILGIWICRCTYDDKDIPLRFKFQWNPESKVWWTKDQAKAEALEDWLE